MAYNIRNIEKKEFRGIYQRIKKDFAPGEYPPYFILNSQLQKGIQKGLVFLAEGIERAYAICADTCENDFVLISLLAVFERLPKKLCKPPLSDRIKTTEVF
jgi:hypothetical protein